MGYVGKTISYLKRNGIRETAQAVMERTDKRGMDKAQREANAYTGRRDPVCREKLSEERFLFSILVPAYETDPAHLRQMIDSVLGQTYRNLQLVLADASVSSRVYEVVSSYRDERLCYHRLSSNKGISDNTNEALKLAEGDYIGLLDHDDVLERDALFHIAAKLMQDGCDMVYTDEDKMSADGARFFEPNFKPDFNLDYLLTNNYICHFTVIRTKIVRELGFRASYDGAQDFDLFLRTVRWIAGSGADQADFSASRMKARIGHVPKVLYHWRAHEKSTADNPESKRYAYEAGKRCLEDFIRSAGWQADVSHTKHLGFYEVDYKPDIFSVRRDVAAVGTSVIKNGRIAKGPVLDGSELFVGMKASYSGYLHRAGLSMEVEKLPEERMIRRRICSGKTGESADGRLVYLPAAQYRKYQSRAGARTTVIIPNYNGMQYLENCLSFLHRCRRTAFETIVVDNGSDDDSVRFIQYRFTWVKVIKLPKNTGFAHAVNVGIRNADTPYVLLLNNDTVVEPDFVEKLEKALESNERYFSFQAKMLSMSEPETIDSAGDLYSALGWAFARGKGADASRYTVMTPIFSACAGAAIYRKDVLEQIGYFDEQHFAYLEDVDLGFRALIAGYKNGYCPDAVVYHAGSGTSGARYNAFKVNLSARNNIYLIAKNMPFLMKLLNLPFLIVGFAVKILFFAKKGFGIVYVRGLMRGIGLSLSAKGRRKRVRFCPENLPNYVKIQLLLWENIIKRWMN